jgi:hypothetical protein
VNKGHLTFGESFDCVSQWKRSEWVSLILDLAALLSLGTVLNRLSVPTFALSLFMPTRFKDSLISHDRVTDKKIDQSIQNGKAQNDKCTQSLQENNFFIRTIRDGEFDRIHL